MSDQRVCLVCGCTERAACADLFGEPCHWVEPGLCSGCVRDAPEPYRGRFRTRPVRAAFRGVGAAGFRQPAEAPA